MAVQPKYQSFTELKLVKATHGVITNARADHLDVMGPSEQDVALALLGSTPLQGKLFTCEQDYIKEFEMACTDRHSELVLINKDDVEAVTSQDLSGFSYIEHKENVALVLKLSSSLGIPREIALRGMWKAKRDPGAMTEVEMEFFGRRLCFVNGFAANDPESSECIWKLALNSHCSLEQKIMVISTRNDRPDRSRQLGEAIINWPHADAYVLIGNGVYQFYKITIGHGMDPTKLICAENYSVEKVFEEIVGQVKSSALIMGIGNIVGPGMELTKYFHNRRLVH